MPRARPTKTYRQTVVAPQDQGSGCLSGFTIVPLAVIFISALLGSFAWKTNPSSLPLPLSASSVSAELPPVISTGISPIFRVEIQYWADSISSWAAASQLDPNLVATIMQIESCGDPRARSSAGAMGLFQVMPFHFYAADDPYNPDTNAARGLAYLVKSLATGGGNARLAMAGYNGGIGVIGRGEWAWPAQTKRYVQYGAPMYEDAKNGIDPSPALNDWYENYGVSLCRQAHQRLNLP
ncbi:MAG TPA: transglycosylase SLT domain-containing protein [Anaerolineales bacterium]|nr:transglycosylase SLT domain-containing protein [Anaerolineales bacterium]